MSHATVGYGSNILSETVRRVYAIEASPEAYEHFRRHFARDNIAYQCSDVFKAAFEPRYGAAVCFEFIEHVHEAAQIVAKVASVTDVLICSTPNELVRPHLQEPVNRFHVRHYTPGELEKLLNEAGFPYIERYSQLNSKTSTIQRDFGGKFMIAVATKYPPSQ
jgi:2-polyprenyl-3-methyl-5-hydroxy-6-metoxy-1,4-benzoquinol methylase